MLDLPYLGNFNQSQSSLNLTLGQLHFQPILSEDGLLGSKAHGFPRGTQEGTHSNSFHLAILQISRTAP